MVPAAVPGYVASETKTPLLMKPIVFRCLPLSVLLFALAACSTATGPTATITNGPVSGPDALQVEVNMPPSWRPMLEDRITDAFVSELADQFDQRGFHGRIGQLYPTDQPAPGSPLLTINLIEWRMGFTGNINCTFAATVRNNGMTRRLGLFNGMSLRWMSGPGRFGLAESYDQAAKDALGQLYDAIARSQLVPGIVAR